jgi:HlyD family secretion protein
MTNKARKRRTIGIALLVVAGIAAGGWYYVQSQSPAPAEAPTLKTAKVRTGDIVITAGGTGNLVAAREANLGFKSGGRLVEILVQIGDRVEAGDVLLRLDDTDAKAQVAQAEINLRIAELKLADVEREAENASIAVARDNLASAETALKALLAGPTPQEIAIAGADLKLAQINLQAAQAAYDRIAYRADAAATKEAQALWQATTAYEKAQATYEQRLAGAGEEQIAAARAKVTSAQAQLDGLLAGRSASDIESATLSVEQARNNLATAKAQVENTILRAPFVGTVTAVKANAGELVGTTPIVSLIATSPALVRSIIEESDLVGVDVGDVAAVTFNALTDFNLSGVVTRISPTVSVVSGVPSAEVIVQLDTVDKDLSWLRVGMSADVEITAAKTTGALLVPVEAVRELAAGSYAVFVVKDDGALELRTVQIGLRDFANVEIISGLNKGEVVSTGTVETQ